MKIILQDEVTGKQLLVQGNGTEFMIYRKAEGRMVNGKLMTKNGKELKNEWVFTGQYPTSVTSAVWHCMQMFLTDIDDTEPHKVKLEKETEKTRILLGKVFKNRLDQIVMNIKTTYDDSYWAGYEAGRNEAEEESNQGEDY